MAGCAVWITGVPGSGKSSVARCVFRHLRDAGLDAVHHEMDRRRKTYFPKPRYTEEERAKAYELFIEEAATLAGQGKLVLMDATAHRAEMRHAARMRIDCFAEIMLVCSVEEAMRREQSRPEGLVMAGMYQKALERKASGRHFKGLGDVIGVDVFFEENDAELVLDNTELSLEETCRAAIRFLDTWLDNA